MLQKAAKRDEHNKSGWHIKECVWHLTGLCCHGNNHNEDLSIWQKRDTLLYLMLGVDAGKRYYQIVKIHIATYYVYMSYATLMKHYFFYHTGYSHSPR